MSVSVRESGRAGGLEASRVYPAGPSGLLSGGSTPRLPPENQPALRASCRGAPPPDCPPKTSRPFGPPVGGLRPRQPGSADLVEVRVRIDGVAVDDRVAVDAAVGVGRDLVGVPLEVEV